jgi:hypothetical protein
MRGPPHVDFDERESVPQPFLQYPRARDGIVFIALLPLGSRERLIGEKSE